MWGRLLPPTLLLLVNSVAGIRVTHNPLRKAQSFQFNPKECRIDSDHEDENAPTAILDYEYYYAMGTVGHVDEVEFNEVQTGLFESAKERILWCFGEDEGDRRNLFDVQVAEQKDHNTQMARELGIQSVSMGPDVLEEDFQCPQNLATLVNRTGTTQCDVRKGTIRVVSHLSDDLTQMSLALQKGLLDAMSLGTVYTEYTRDITFLSYLGDILDNSWMDDPTSDPNSDRGAFVTDLTEDDDDDGGAGFAIPLALGLGIPMALLLLLLAWCKGRTGPKIMSEKDAMMLKDGHVVNDDDPNQIGKLYGTGDPPGSFHQGLYHYMPDGTRYLSTRCKGCDETRKNAFYTDDNLGTIPEGEPFDENGIRAAEPGLLLRADPNHLGSYHASMDVHKCSSATCTRCCAAGGHNDQNSRTTFLPTGNSNFFNMPTFWSAQEAEV